MVVWHALEVPFAEQDIARSLGAKWHEGSFHCNATQWKSREFKRWHDRTAWRRVKIYIGDGPAERAAAKWYRCMFDPASVSWYVEITHKSSILAWHRARLEPLPEYALRVTYAEHEEAKREGCRWRPNLRRWVFSAPRGVALPPWVASHQ